MPLSYQEILSFQLGANTVLQYTVAVGLFAVVLILLSLFRKFLLVKLRAFVEKTNVQIDDLFVDVLEGISGLFYFAIALFVAVQHLTLPHYVRLAVHGFILVILVYEVIKAVEKILSYAVMLHMERATEEDREKQKKMSTVFTLIIRTLLWIVGLLLILSNLGINVNSLVASLGIGGIAVSLALQNVLGDLFSSFAIAFDKPFEEGDFIVIGEFKGTVKKIGLKTTRIQALQGEEVVISNNELTTAKLQNFKKMQKRRVVFTLGLTYGTPMEKLKKIPGIAQKIIENQDNTEFDRTHFKEFGDFSLNFEVVYYLLSSDYNEYMDTQQAVNLGLVEAFEKEGIEFAFPTQTILLQKS